MFKSYDSLIKDLISQVRKDGQEAFEELLGLYMPLIHSFVSKFVKQSGETQNAEDFQQELTVLFHHAILSYDLEQSDVSFGLYAKICMNNFMITQLRAQKKKMGTEFLILDKGTEIDERAEAGDDLVKEVIRREELRELNKKIEEALSSFENTVWKYYLSGCSAREISISLGRPEKSIENAIFRIRQKLKGLFL